jgi:hypothetical protein
MCTSCYDQVISDREEEEEEEADDVLNEFIDQLLENAA